MQLFFEPTLQIGKIQLSETTSRHCVQVLRMQEGQTIELTNGLGESGIGYFVVADKKKSIVAINEIIKHPPPNSSIYLAIAFTKNPSRMEWLLEKITEIGIQHIIPIQTHRTEKIHFKKERFENIIVSALLQSKQYYLPLLHDLVPFQTMLEQFQHIEKKYIAHCINEKERSKLLPAQFASLVCIGPEGDFTEDEINKALHHQFEPITLGATRLRTETAGLVAVTLLNQYP